MFCFFFHVLFSCGFALSFGSLSHFGDSDLLYLAIDAMVCSFLLLLILVRSAMLSTPRVRLARQDIVEDAPLSLLAHAHALQVRAPLVVQFGTAATTSVPWSYLNLLMSLITSLLLKLASLLLLLLLMELILILTAVLILGDSREKPISNF